MRALLSFACFLALVASASILTAQTPQWLWAYQMEAPINILPYATATDGSGNCFVTGWFSGNAVFGSVTLECTGGDDIFLAKYSPSGELLWATRGGGPGGDESFGITADDAGNVWITGYAGDGAVFGSTTLSGGSGFIFVAKANPNGTWLWANKNGDTGAYGDDRGHAITADPQGNSYITGYIKGNAIFGDTILNTLSGDEPAAFVAKLDSSGEWVWSYPTFGITYGDRSWGHGIDVDGFGDLVIAGLFMGQMAVGSTQLASDGLDAFVAKFSGQSWSWARKAGGGMSDKAWAVAADNAGNCYVAGCFTVSASFGPITLTSSDAGGDGFVGKLDQSGSWLWVAQAGGAGSQDLRGIALGGDGNVCVGGYYSDPTICGSHVLPSSAGGFDCLAAKLDPAGNFIWALGAGGGGEDWTQGISCDTEGNSFPVGRFGTAAVFGGNSLYQIIGPYGGFVAKASSGGSFSDDQQVPEAAGPRLSVWPNPLLMGDTAVLKADLPEDESASVSIHNLRGQLLKVWDFSAGTSEAVFNTAGLPTGIYLCRLKSAGAVRVAKLVIMP